jgi:site-specific recombinase XerD
MHDLIPLEQIPTGALTTAEIDQTMAYAEAEKAASTREAYASDWREFAVWCHARGATPLPAHAGIVAAYLSALAHSGRKSSTIGRKAAAMEGVRAVLRGIRRTIGTAPAQKTAATAVIVRQMLRACPDSMIGLRDRALLSFGFASAMRRSEIVALRVEDLTWVDDGVRVLIRKSKTDQEGQGQEIAVPRGLKLCPVAALQAWLAAAEISAGPVFRAVALGGKVSAEPLAKDSASRIVKRYAARVGLDPRAFAGHSLRSGVRHLGGGGQCAADEDRRADPTQVDPDAPGLHPPCRPVRDHAGAAFL